MSQDEVRAQWEELGQEHEAARDAYFRAFATVNRKFEAIGRGTSTANPTGAELSEFEKTRHAWQDVIRRVGEFVKKHV